MGNRLVGNFQVKLGIEPGTKEKDLPDAKKRKMLDVLRQEYQRITDGIIVLDAKGEGIISTQAEMSLVRHYVALLHEENVLFDDMEQAVLKFPLWEHFLKGVKGVGRAMAGVILSEFDPHKALYPSSFHAYAGLDVVTDSRRAHKPDSKGRSRRKEHQVTVPYTNKKGEQAERESITFNPFLKTKLIGVLGPSFLRSKSSYADIYHNERQRLQNHPAHMDKTLGHQHAMGIRKMIKNFLIDLHVEWRALEGLPATKPFHVEKLGMREHRQTG